MIKVMEGFVTKILKEWDGVQEIFVDLEGKEEKALNYTFISGEVYEGNRVLLNTTAVALGLGTGGYHFVMANLSSPQIQAEGLGHIMKLRYTPYQLQVLAGEEEASPLHKEVSKFTSLKGTPVVVGTLHSQLPPIAVGIKETSPKLKVAYVMSDGAALPLPMSRLVHGLKQKGLIDMTITYGHAFGGDYEAVSKFSALALAKSLGADVIVVTMGPGIVGTGTKWGYTGVEQGEVINAANILKGKVFAVPRISFADKRERHQGVSHHFLTALGEVALTSCTIPLPELEAAKEYLIRQQLGKAGLLTKHKLEIVPSSKILSSMEKKYQIKVTTMGRSLEQDREFFLAATSAGIAAANHVVS